MMKTKKIVRKESKQKAMGEKKKKSETERNTEFVHTQETFMLSLLTSWLGCFLFVWPFNGLFEIF